MVIDQKITDKYSIYNADNMDVMPNIPENSIHISVYSPPFISLFNYSSSVRDLSNCKSYDDFFKHYEFVVEEMHRMTMPGRINCVHCIDVPIKNDGGFFDFPGDIIKLHQKVGFQFEGRRAIWKEPLRMAIRTRSKGLMHKQLVKDAIFSNVAGADYLLSFRKKGENKIPVTHSEGLKKYCGEKQPPQRMMRKYENWKDQKTNKLSHYIWQRYASSVWNDIRVDHVLEYKPARDSEEEKHVCPLQLDVIERCVLLWSNPDEILFTPFMGVGSEVYGALINGRKGIGVELKETYYNQAKKNLRRTKERRIKKFGEMS